MTDPQLSPNDIVTVRGESTPNYRASVEIINGDRITVRPLPNQNMTTRARAVNRVTILGVVTKAKPKPPAAAVEAKPTKVSVPKAAPQAIDAPTPPDNDLAALRVEVALALRTNFPEASQAWRNGWRAACTRLLTQIDNRIAARKPHPLNDGASPETTEMAAE